MHIGAILQKRNALDKHTHHTRHIISHIIMIIISMCTYIYERHYRHVNYCYSADDTLYIHYRRMYILGIYYYYENVCMCVCFIRCEDDDDDDDDEGLRPHQN